MAYFQLSHILEVQGGSRSDTPPWLARLDSTLPQPFLTHMARVIPLTLPLGFLVHAPALLTAMSMNFGRTHGKDVQVPIIRLLFYCVRI